MIPSSTPNSTPSSTVTQDAVRLAERCRDFADTEVLSTIGSTNQYLLEQTAPDLNRPKFVWTHEQTRGRGRRGRTWFGPPEHSLIFSMQFCRAAAARSDARQALDQLSRQPQLSGQAPQHPLTGLPIAVGVALAEILQQFAPELRLKWPNDLQRAGRKFGGILIETRHRAAAVIDDAGIVLPKPQQFEQVVIGVGLNLFVEPEWHQAVGQPVCGLFDTASYPLRATIAEQVARKLHDAWLEFQISGVEGFLSRWHRWDALFGLPVRVLDDDRVLLQGVAAGLSSTGTLLVQTESGRQEVSFGDVSVRTGEMTRGNQSPSRTSGTDLQD